MKRITDQTLYEILEVPPDATPAAIAAAVERAQELYAPGSLATYTLMSAEEAELLVRRIDEAQSTLLDPAARRRYDDDLAHRRGEVRAAANGTPARPWSEMPPVIPARKPAPEVEGSDEDDEDGDADDVRAAAPPEPPARTPPPVPAAAPRPIQLSREVKPAPAAPEAAPAQPAEATPAEPAEAAIAPPSPPPAAAVAPTPPAAVTPPVVTTAPAPPEPTRTPVPTATPVPMVPPAPAPAAPPVPDATAWTGEVLRQIREARGITLQQLSERTKVTRHHIENIEADRYASLPAPVYLRGILLSLARELRLDGQKVARSYLERFAAGTGQATAPKSR